MKKIKENRRTRITLTKSEALKLISDIAQAISRPNGDHFSYPCLSFTGDNPTVDSLFPIVFDVHNDGD